MKQITSRYIKNYMIFYSIFYLIYIILPNKECGIIEIKIKLSLSI